MTNLLLTEIATRYAATPEYRRTNLMHESMWFDGRFTAKLYDLHGTSTMFSCPMTETDARSVAWACNLPFSVI